ncbi:hypothetical protein K1719_037488 [Acacia pycnantha]|nr:hypothetical protein K1719_037488 [Acacia pycnantha]
MICLNAVMSLGSWLQAAKIAKSTYPSLDLAGNFIPNSLVGSLIGNTTDGERPRLYMRMMKVIKFFLKPMVILLLLLTMLDQLE